MYITLEWSIADGSPAVRQFQPQLKLRLEVWLVKAWESAAGVVRHKERVHIILMTVQRFFSAHASYPDLVLALFQPFF